MVEGRGAGYTADMSTKLPPGNRARPRKSPNLGRIENDHENATIDAFAVVCLGYFLAKINLSDILNEHKSLNCITAKAYQACANPAVRSSLNEIDWHVKFGVPETDIPRATGAQNHGCVM